MERHRALQHACLLFAAALLLLLVTIKLYKTITSPLSRLPGPALSKWTRWPMKITNLRGERTTYVHSLHERYGSVVRIAPQEVSLSSLDAVKTIYKVGGSYYKSPWYTDFTGVAPPGNLFTMLDPKLHGHQRRLQAHHFTEKYIKGMEQDIIRTVRLAMTKMAEEHKIKGYFDGFKWLTFMTNDVIGDAAFGESFHMLETGKINQLIQDLQDLGASSAWRAEFPTLVKAFCILPFGPARAIQSRVQRVLDYSRASIERYRARLKVDPDNVKPTLATRLCSYVDEGLVSEDQLVRNSRSYIVAGTDTTAFTLTFAVWYLANHSDIEQELIREISAVPADSSDEVLRELKLLNGVINEALRLRGPVGEGLPRVVPPGGAEFDGFFIPENTTVSIPAWTMHRNPEVWKDPDRFDPARWYEPTKAMRDSFLPWGGGSRICIGIHFAQLEMRHALSSFYRTFDSGVESSTAQGFSDADMEHVSYFIMSPKGRRCLLTRRK